MKENYWVLIAFLLSCAVAVVSAINEMYFRVIVGSMIVYYIFFRIRRDTYVRN